MLESDLCDYSDVYISLKGSVIVANSNDANYKKKLTFKNNAPFISCISKVNNTLFDNAKDLDIVIRMYDLTEYSKNVSKTKTSLLHSYRDEPNRNLGG